MSARRVAVVGGGLGGLVAAGELARAGLQVTLYEAGPTLGGKAGTFEKNGLTFDTGPTLLTMPDVIRRAFTRLEADDLLPRFVELKAQCSYAWQDGAHLTVHRDLDQTAASAEELGPGGGASMRAFYAEAEALNRAVGEPLLGAPFEGMASFAGRVLKQGVSAARRGVLLGTLDEFARRFFKSPRLRQFAGRFATYAGASPFHATSGFAMIAHLERAEGVHHPVGGMGALARALGLALGRLGVEVHLNQRAHALRQRGVLVAGPAGGEVEVEAVVMNADPLAYLGRGDEPLAMSGLVLLIDVDRRVKLPHHTVLFSRDSRHEFDELFAGRMPTDATMYVCHPAASDPSMAPEGRSGLFVMLNAPARLELDTGSLTAWCLGRLREEFSELRTAKLEVVAQRTPRDFAARGAPGGSLYGFLPHGVLGPFRRPRQRSTERGIYFAGGGTHPGGGVPLVMRSGEFAARLVTADLGVTR
jgi:phytoene desaturase